jgi:hypothetical protein
LRRYFIPASFAFVSAARPEVTGAHSQRRGQVTCLVVPRFETESKRLDCAWKSVLCSGVLDRRDKECVTLLFAAVPNNSSIKVKQNNREIERADFQACLPKKASPSAKYIWSARRGQLTRLRKFELQLTSSSRSCELRRPLLLSNSKGALANFGHDCPITGALAPQLK